MSSQRSQKIENFHLLHCSGWLLAYVLPGDKAVLEPWVSPAFAITHLIAMIVVSDLTLYQNMNQRSLTLRWTLTPSLLRSHVWYYPRIIVCKSHEIHQSTWIQCPFLFKTFNQRSLTPRWPLTPSLLRSHVRLYPRIIVSKSHENTSKCVDTVTPFFKNLNQRSLTPRWPLTSCLLRSHVWLYPRIIVSKSHGNTSMYVDTVINFAKYHLHTQTYILRTIYRMSDHIVSFWTRSGETKTEHFTEALPHNNIINSFTPT